MFMYCRHIQAKKERRLSEVLRNERQGFSLSFVIILLLVPVRQPIKGSALIFLPFSFIRFRVPFVQGYELMHALHCVISSLFCGREKRYI